MNKKTQGISLTTLLLVLFIALKLTGVIDWPWIWVLSPLWIPLVIVFGVLLVIAIIGLIAAIMAGRR